MALSAALAASAPLSAQNLTAQELNELCRGDAEPKSICVGFLVGVRQTMGLYRALWERSRPQRPELPAYVPPDFCRNTTNAELRRIYLAYFETLSDEHRDELAAIHASVAFFQVLGCRAE